MAPTCVDLSNSVLSGPVLPSNIPPPDLLYPRFERIQTYLACQCHYPEIGDIPASFLAEVDTLAPAALRLYQDFYALTHPESMIGVSADRQSVIPDAYITRIYERL